MATAVIRRDDDDETPNWKLARKGIQLLINNKTNAAEALFKTTPESIQLYAGYSFTVFMDAIMTLEDDKLNLALMALKETERRCYADNSWLKTMKSKMFGSEQFLSEAENLENQIIVADTQVCIAILIFLQQDVSGMFKGGWILRKSWKIYQHTYNTIKNLYKEIVGELPDAVAQNLVLPTPGEEEETAAEGNISSQSEFPPEETLSKSPSHRYISSRPYSSRMTHSLTNDTLCNYKYLHNNCSFNNNCKNSNNRDSKSYLTNAHCGTKNGVIDNSFKASLLKKSASVNSALSKCLGQKRFSFNTLSIPYFYSSFNFFLSEKQKSENIDKETIKRLMGAISFGYGLFHLGVSLLPPSLLKIINFLGFGGNRNLGIANLMYAREGADMRAPLATLALLWYHTIVRPFYGIDGRNVQAGVNAATQLLIESQMEYENSALFLFFKGRVHRLNSDICEALKAFQASVDNSTHREVKILSLHEVGWCHLLQLDYSSAENAFATLKLCSRWSRSFYGYLSVICAGSCNSSKIWEKMREVRKLFNSSPKNNQLDIFLMRRLSYCPSDVEDVQQKNSRFWALLVYELLYLWNTLPSCSYENIQHIINDCKKATIEPMTGLSLLIKGNCYCILNKYEDGVQCFRRCLELRKNTPVNTHDAHISAFAAYELGQILIKEKRTNVEGRSFLIQSSNFKDYDFEQRLNLRIHTLLHLNKESN
ncbi:hypothetical protein FQA39_LY18072 [Lamprigera yunnana]|nr:hypothetical protein FQA39_LY18072 [Lamprigera yunnana]